MTSPHPHPSPDIKGLGGFRRLGWLSIHGQREQDSLSVGSLQRRARHSAALLSALLPLQKKKEKTSASSFRRSARRIAAGTDCFHAAGLITNVFQRAARERAGVRGAEEHRSLANQKRLTPPSRRKGSFGRSPCFQIKALSKVCAGLFRTQRGASVSTPQLTAISPTEIRNLYENKSTEAAAGEWRHGREIRPNETAVYSPGS